MYRHRTMKRKSFGRAKVFRQRYKVKYLTGYNFTGTGEVPAAYLKLPQRKKLYFLLFCITSLNMICCKDTLQKGCIIIRS